MAKPLAPYFTYEELGVLGCEDRIVQNAIEVCHIILIPVREHFAKPVRVHDGYRDWEHNMRVGGKPTSFHLYDEGKGAGDFDVVGAGLVQVFDWIRLESKLMFDKIILEKRGGIPRCIHAQINRFAQPRRLAYVGGTGDSTSYQKVEVH